MAHQFASDIWQNIPVPSNTLIFATQDIKENSIEFVSGAVAGVASLIVGHPLDTVKTVTQNSARKLAIKEGIAGVGKHGYVSEIHNEF